jgi:gluconate kinase
VNRSVLVAARPELQVLFVSGYLDQLVLPERIADRPRTFCQTDMLDVMLHTVRELLDRPAKFTS